MVSKAIINKFESGFLNDHTLTKVDISDYRNIAFFIEDGLEIKIGNSNFKERLGQLTKTLASIVVDKDEIKYIDLRFDDVVDVTISVAGLGENSITYLIEVLKGEDLAASGRVVTVFVDRESGMKTVWSDSIRRALAAP